MSSREVERRWMWREVEGGGGRRELEEVDCGVGRWKTGMDEKVETFEGFDAVMKEARRASSRDPAAWDPTQMHPTHWDPTQLHPTRWDPTQRHPTRWDPRLMGSGWTHQGTRQRSYVVIVRGTSLCASSQSSSCTQVLCKRRSKREVGYAPSAITDG